MKKRLNEKRKFRRHYDCYIFEISKKDDEVWHATRELIEQGFVEVKTDFVLLDDLEARVYARSSGLNAIGTLGIIQALLRRGIVKETPKEIYRKLKSIDFWITNDLFSKVFV
jgi:predicted nucleic acid-binding protein